MVKNADNNKNPVVIYSPNRWDEPWTSRHRIAVGLSARGWETIYTSGPLSTWERGTEQWSNARLMGNLQKDKGLYVDRPGKVEAFWPGSRLVQNSAVNRHTKRLRKSAMHISAETDRLTAFLFHPRFLPHARALKPDRLIYFSYDAISLSPGWNDELAEYEKQLVRHADLIVAYSANMFDYMPDRARQIGHELPTGVDFDHFKDAASAECPEDLAVIPAPRVGYCGHINQKLDLVNMVSIAESAEDFNFIFVGPAGPGNSGHFDGHPDQSAAWRRMQELPNVFYLGPKDFSDVPAYMGNMDVNIMCYRLEGGWWQAGYPLKMHEYLAVGKPIVSTGLSTIIPFKDVIDIVSTRDEWLTALKRALSGGVSDPEERRRVSQANSWDVRLDLLDSWMRDIA